MLFALKGMFLLMIKNKVIQAVAFALAVVFFVFPTVRVVALDVPMSTGDYGYAPTIFVSGILSRDIYKNLGTEQEAVMMPPSMDNIKEEVTAETIMNFAKFAVSGDFDYIADAVIPIADKVFEDFGCYPDGTHKADTGIKWSYPTYINPSPNKVAKFYYDWREDPIVVAAQLNDYVEYVCDMSLVRAGCRNLKSCNNWKRTS
jgi:hypothetical protein